MNGRTSQQLFSLLTQKFSLPELRELAFALGIDPENLSGTTKREYALSLVQYAERRELFEKLNELVDSVLAGHKELPQGVPEPVSQDSGKTAVWLTALVGIVLLIVALVLFWPDPETSTEEPLNNDRILLQVQVLNGENQTALANAKVSLDYAGSLFPQESTDSTGRAVFVLPAEAEGEVVRITVEANGQVETQDITVDEGMRAVVFQIKP